MPYRVKPPAAVQQREFLAVLDWILEAPERWDLAVAMSCCPHCTSQTGVCEEHRAEFRRLEGKDEVEV